MGAVKNETISFSILSTAAITRKRFVSPTGGVPAANGNTLGVNDYTVASGESMLIDHIGLTIVESGAALPTLGAFLATDNQGRAIPWSAGAVRVGILAPIANNTASGAGQLVSIIALANFAPTA